MKHPHTKKPKYIPLLAIPGVVILAVLVYAAYVFLSYYRLEDRLALEVFPAASSTYESLSPAIPYRVASYNIGFGAYSADYTFFMDGGSESRARSKESVYENIDGAITALQAMDADFLLLQEVDIDGTRSHHINEAALVLKAMGEAYCGTFAQNYDSPYLFWPLLEPHGANRSGQLTLSRYPIRSALRRSLPIEESLMKLVDLDRCYSVQRIPVEDGNELVLYNFHLSAYTSDGTIAEEQLKMLFADMLAEYQKGNYAVAGGDFNKDLLGDSSAVFGISGAAYTWAQPIPEELIPEGLSVVAPLDSGHPVPSCRNADRPYGPDDFVLVVDGFIVSDNVTVVDSTAVDTAFQWSDHNPVYLDFILQSDG